MTPLSFESARQKHLRDAAKLAEELERTAHQQVYALASLAADLDEQGLTEEARTHYVAASGAFREELSYKGIASKCRQRAETRTLMEHLICWVYWVLECLGLEYPWMS